jgi:hypothetical protein
VDNKYGHINARGRIVVYFDVDPACGKAVLKNAKGEILWSAC